MFACHPKISMILPFLLECAFLKTLTNFFFIKVKVFRKWHILKCIVFSWNPASRALQIQQKRSIDCEVLFVHQQFQWIKINPISIFTLSADHSLEQNSWRLLYNLQFPLRASKADQTRYCLEYFKSEVSSQLAWSPM